jgi:hypothetical protein
MGVRLRQDETYAQSKGKPDDAASDLVVHIGSPVG